MTYILINNEKLFVHWYYFKFIAKYNQSFNLNVQRCSYTKKAIVNKLTMPESPRPSFIQSFLSLIFHDKALNLHEIVNKRHEELGPIYKERMGSFALIFTNSPNEYRKIFKLEGDTPKHFIPEVWIRYNNMNKCSRGLLFM